MNEAVKRFLDQMGEGYAAEGDRDVSPILFKADDENGGKVYELSLPKGEPHPYWRVREREMVPDEVVALAQKKLDVQAGGIGFTFPGGQYKVRGFVCNARERNKWNFSVEKVQ